jgi:hypothetical protein
MTRDDAYKLHLLHLEKHGIQGMVGSLDCMHVAWKNCPVAWQGQYRGKEKKPTVVLEAVADHHLWIWHSAFGYAGTLNDINIWDQSPLMQSFLDGTFPDFEFEIDNCRFKHLWLLVVGIYPETARFVKPISQPERDLKVYAQWQESSRKDIEQAFGVLQRKFQIIKRPMESWYILQMHSTMMTSILLHNMMVEHRVHNDESEHSDMYQVFDDNLPEAAAPDQHQRYRYQVDAANEETIFRDNDHHDCWGCLTNKHNHLVLQTAIRNKLVRRQQQRQQRRNDNEE